jgi:hypothetical protein
VPLADWDEARQAPPLDRPDEPLGVDVQVRAAQRELDGIDTRGAKQAGEAVGEHRVPVIDHEAEGEQEVVGRGLCAAGWRNRRVELIVIGFVFSAT